MRVSGIKFNEEGISKFIMAFIERFATDEFMYVKEIKKQLRLGEKDSIDIIILLDEYEDKIQHLYDGLNFRLQYNGKIPTYFRGKDGKSFLFPGGLNVIFTNYKEYRRLHDKWHIIAAVTEPYGLLGLIQPDVINGYLESMILVIDKNAYFSEDKEVMALFMSKPVGKDLSQYL